MVAKIQIFRQIYLTLQQKYKDMEENLRSELVERVAHELTAVGQRTDETLSEESVAAILSKCMNAITPEESETLLTLISQAFDCFVSGCRPEVTEVRPKVLECDVVRFQNNREKWVALVGLLNGYPYEIFTGLADDEEGIVLPKTVTTGKIIKQVNPDGTKRYDFQFENKRGYKTTVEGLSEKFNPEYWNYAKLISGVLRYRMPIENVIKLVASLSLKDESINTWKTGVERALKKYAPGAQDEEQDGGFEE